MHIIGTNIVINKRVIERVYTSCTYIGMSQFDRSMEFKSWSASVGYRLAV